MYSQREAFLAKREAEGELTFKYVENNGVPDNSMWCVYIALTLSLRQQHLQDQGLMKSCHYALGAWQVQPTP